MFQGRQTVLPTIVVGSREEGMRQPKEVILDALNQYRGDDLERAEIAFLDLSDIELNKEYGASGKTCREILAGYRKHRAEVNNAAQWLKGVS